jgi:hypothetical protein
VQRAVVDHILVEVACVPVASSGGGAVGGFGRRSGRLGAGCAEHFFLEVSDTGVELGVLDIP